MGIGLNKMQINSIVICSKFIDNSSIHVCSFGAQPPHTSMIVNATSALPHARQCLSTKINISIN